MSSRRVVVSACMQGQSREAEEAVSACLDELAQRRRELPALLLELRRGDHTEPAQPMLRRQQRRLVQHGAHLWGREPGAVVSTGMLMLRERQRRLEQHGAHPAETALLARV